MCDALRLPSPGRAIMSSVAQVSSESPLNDVVVTAASENRSAQEDQSKTSPADVNPPIHSDNVFRELQSKRFYGLKDTISTAALGQGFSFAVKQPPRPGQFSERPPHRSINNIETKNATVSDTTCSRHFCLPSHDDNVTHPPPFPGPSTSPKATQDEKALKASSSNSVAGSVHGITAHCVQSGPNERFGGQPQAQDPRPDTSLALKDKAPASSFNHLPEGMKTLGEQSSLPLTKHAIALSNEKANTAQASIVHSAFNKNSSISLQGEKKVFDNLPLFEGKGEQNLRKTRDWNEWDCEQPPQSSICGDLESPTLRIPPATLPRSSKHPGEHHQSYDVELRNVNNRSTSRTSNVSKKRTAVRRHRPRFESERKKLAMQQVAEYWNECMQIAEDEKLQASSEIDHLQRDLSRHKSKVLAYRSVIDEKDRDRKIVDRRCQAHEASNLQLEEKNRQLNLELQLLRSQLSEREKRATAFEEKQRRYRVKLNEAIEEQQALFLRSRESFEKTLSELKNDNEKRILEVNMISDTLLICNQQRDAFRQELANLRSKIENEGNSKDRIILELETRVRSQDVSLHLEREQAANLRLQGQRHQEAHDAQREILTKLDSFFALSKRRDQEQHEIATTSKQLETRMENLGHMIMEAISSDSALPTVQALGRVESTITSLINGAVAEVAMSQNQMEGKICKLAVVCASEIELVRDLMTRADAQDAVVQAKQEEVSKKTLECLETLKSSTWVAKETCRRTNDNLVKWLADMSEHSKTSIDASQAAIGTAQAEQCEKLNYLKDKIQRLSEEMGSKVNLLGEQMSKFEVAAELRISRVGDELRAIFDGNACQERENLQQGFHKAYSIMAAVENQVKAVLEQLSLATTVSADCDVPVDLDGSSLSGKNLGREQGRPVVEDQANTNKDLCSTQRINIIEDLRNQLRTMQRSMDQIGGFDITLDRISRVNDILFTTTQFLRGENRWVRQQKERQHVSKNCQIDNTKVADKSGYETARQGDEEEHPSIGQVSDRIISTKRKVLVHSPACELPTPSTPLSIEQEQRRRRGANQPRSILKLSTCSTRVVGNLPKSAMRKNFCQTRYNRPMVGSVGAAANSAVIAEEVRSRLDPNKNSGLIQPKVIAIDRSEKSEKVEHGHEAEEALKITKRALEGESGPSFKRKRLEDEAR